MDEIIKYLQSSIDEKAEIRKWNAKELLNLQLAGSYEYYVVSALRETFMLIKPLEEFTISKIKIHIRRITEKTGYEVAILLQSPTMYRVKKMIQERVAFVTIDKQMYLPFMALHIKQNRMNDVVITEREKFTASTQLVFLYILYSKRTEFGTDELAKRLNVSAMTILRAMEELKHLDIIKQKITGKTGRKKIYTPIEKKEFYRIGKDYLINPVKTIFYVDAIPDGISVYRAGEMALSEQTMLAEPANEVFATFEKRTSFVKHIVTKVQALTEGLPEVQIMQYDIGRLTQNKYVDPISLIMSITRKDDRTEMAIDELMEGVEWYEE
ncbi:MAG: hypothetical protein ACI4EE_04080 [Lachnospiraceae bacterium]